MVILSRRVLPKLQLLWLKILFAQYFVRTRPFVLGVRCGKIYSELQAYADVDF
jgi:hypothetical protein